MSRLFTFGCSFTNYFWPTWADILARQHDQHQNWARSGAGNHFVFNSLVECHKRNKITQDDTVGIMWSSIAREDRYVEGRGWIVTGTIADTDVYDKKWVEEFADPMGFLLRDLAFVAAAKQMLDSIGCRYFLCSIVPFPCYDDWWQRFFSPEKKILELYHDDVSAVRPSVYETVFAKDWYSREGYVDYARLKKRYDENRGKDWPQSWPEFLGMFKHKTRPITVSSKIQKEIHDQFDFRRDLIRTDYHPTPAEHLEYLEKAVPEIVVPEADRAWALKMDQDLKNYQSAPETFWPEARVQRF